MAYGEMDKVENVLFKDFSANISSPNALVTKNVGVSGYRLVSIICTGQVAHRFSPLLINNTQGSEQVWVSCGDAATVNFRAFYIKADRIVSA